MGSPVETYTTSCPPFFLRDSRASETRARVKITPREKRRHRLSLVETRQRAVPFSQTGRRLAGCRDN